MNPVASHLGRSLFAALAAALVVAAVGCASETKRAPRAFAAHRPWTIAVLPFHVAHENGMSRERAEFVRQSFAARLGMLPYVVLDTDLVDRRLRRAGINEPPPNDDWPIGALRSLSVDAVVMAELSPYRVYETYVYNARVLRGDFRLVSLEDGKVLWQSDRRFVHNGGLVCKSGQAFKWFGELFGSERRLFELVVLEFVENALRDFPMVERMRAVPSRLAITDYAIRPSRDGTLGLGDRIDFEIEAQPDLLIRVEIDGEHYVSLYPTADGTYRGSYVPAPGQRFETRWFEAVVRSHYGQIRRVPLMAERPIVVEAAGQKRSDGASMSRTTMATQ